MQNISLSTRAKAWARRISDPSFTPELMRRARRKLLETVKGKDPRTESCKDWCASVGIKGEEFLKGHGVSDETLKKYAAFEAAEAPKAQQKLNDSGMTQDIGAANMQVLYCLAEHHDAANILETGVAYAWSSLAILHSLHSRDKGHLISNDLPPTANFSEDYIGMLVPEEMKSRWTFIRGADRESLKKIHLDGKRFDLMHYDSDKTYEGRRWSYAFIYDHLLKPGGILMSDDIDDNYGFKDFCDEKGLTPVIIDDTKNNKFEGIVFKPA